MRNWINMNTLEQVIDCIDRKESFLLEAGAGSGKTWTLIAALNHILEKQGLGLQRRNKRIVCITYTNVAKDEIRERINYNPLVIVGTIHEFLWEVISPFQTELKLILDELNQGRREPFENLLESLEGKQIDYSQFGANYGEGRISHDEVLEMASRIFDEYPKIAQLMAARFPYLFVDEYQDTEERIVDLLAENWLARNQGKVVLGFFGDSMQKIYNRGIGRFQQEGIREITKHENFRCSEKVIELLNRIRPELLQIPAGDNLQGDIGFYHADGYDGDSSPYDLVLADLERNGWTFDPVHTKILYLTHRGIAKQMSYENLLKAYNDRGRYGRDILYNLEDPYSNLFFSKIEPLAELYRREEYGEFNSLLAFNGFKLKKHSDKLAIRALMEELNTLRADGTIAQVLEYIFSKRLLAKPKTIREFEAYVRTSATNEEDSRLQRNARFHDFLMEIAYSEVTGLGAFIADHTPFSTKHGVKGAEFENVLVVIDDTSWNQYKFADVFAGNVSNQGRYDRTRNLLYVCCSRAKNRLAVLALSKMGDVALSTVNDWFGNCISVADIEV